MSTPSPDKPFVIDHAQLRRARNLARQNGCTVIAELERLNGGAADELVQQLATLFGMGVADANGLRALMPAFDLLSLPLARRWRCVLLRDADGTLVGVVADPFDPDLQLWLNSQAHGVVLLRLTSSTDLQAFLDSFPESGHSPHGTDRAGELGDTADDAVDALVLEATRDLLRRAMGD